MTSSDLLVSVTDAAECWSELLHIHETTATAAYAHIFSGSFPHEEAAARWKSYGGAVVAAVENGSMVGFGARSDDWLDALYVLPQAAGRGIGGRLLGLLPQAQRLWVLVDNKGGRKFYERHGWCATGETQPAYGSVMETLYRRG